MALWHLGHVLRCVQAGAASPARCNAAKLSLELCCARRQSPFSGNQSRLVQTGLPLDTGRPRLVILGTGWAAARLARDIDTSLYDLTVRNTYCGLSFYATIEAERWPAGLRNGTEYVSFVLANELLCKRADHLTSEPYGLHTVARLRWLSPHCYSKNARLQSVMSQSVGKLTADCQ